MNKYSSLYTHHYHQMRLGYVYFYLHVGDLNSYVSYNESKMEE